jgi:drug/metabolite transporter (DMT)-like permease
MDDPIVTGAVESPPTTSAAAPPRDTAAPTSLWRARLLVVAAALCWSTSGFFVKAPVFANWSGPALAFWRAAFACLMLWPLVRRPKWSWKLVPMAVMFAAMNYTYLTAMAEGSAANAIWLQCTGQVWVLLIGVWFFKERAVGRDWLFVACAAAGVGLILYFEWQAGAAADIVGQQSGPTVSLEAVGWGLASGALYGGIVLSLRQLREQEPVWLAAVNHLVTAVALLPFAFVGGHFPSGIQWLMLAALGMLQMGLPYVLFAHALRRIPGHEALGIGMIEPILVPVWVYLAWGDPPAWWTLVGGGFILAGLIIRYLGVAQDPAEGKQLGHQTTADASAKPGAGSSRR